MAVPPPFDENLSQIADSMGISLYQRFSVTEASLFLRCPLQELQDLVTKKNIQRLLQYYFGLTKDQ